MATASTQKLQDIVECPICLETLTEPRMFGCFHFYCQKCVHDMKEVKQDETVGYECPLCRVFTAKTNAKAVPIMCQLLEVIANDDANIKCDTCENEQPQWRCLDCKESYCGTCRAHHNRFKMFQSHEMIELSESSKPIIDELVLCHIHPSKPLEFHCRDCKQLICLLCRGTSHHHHAAETIEEALQQVIPVVHTHQTKVKVKIEETKAAIAEQKNKIQESEDDFAFLRGKVEDKYEEITERLKEDWAKLGDEIDDLEKKKHATLKNRVKQLELQLQSRENVLKMTESTLDTAKNVSLLNTLQSGVLNSLRGAIENQDTATTADEYVVDFDEIAEGTANLLGTVKKKPPPISCELEITCDALMKSRFVQRSSHKLRFYCSRFDVINSELWCIEEGTKVIHVFSMEGQRKDTIAFTNLRETWSVVAFNNKALVSSTNGLFLVSTTIEHDVTKVVEGSFCDASVVHNTVFALEITLGKVYNISSNKASDLFTKRKEFEVMSHIMNSRNTIQATPDHVFVALNCRHVIQQYTLNGQLLREHGRYGSNVGQLHCPLLSGIDSFNNILIAGNFNSRLDILRKDGSFRTLLLTQIGKKPMCARFYQGKLFVVLYNSKMLQVFITQNGPESSV